METPTTRSRKRPAQASQGSQPSQEGSGVTWARDTALLDEVRARPSAPLPLPSPTQRPRALAPARSGGPRKRPCRLGRNATPSASSSTFASSLASTPAVDTRRLDELLERFDLWPSPTSRPGARVSQPQARRPLGERTNRIAAAHSLPDVKKPAPLDRRTTQSAAEVRPTPAHAAGTKPAPRAPPPPRLGQRPRPQEQEEVDLRRPFRTPWAAPTRSSPRRKPPVDYSPRPLRANVNSTPSRLRSTAAPPPAEDMPSSEGDTSVDSLDEFLNAGGADVQDLFSMLDSY